MLNLHRPVVDLKTIAFESKSISKQPFEPISMVDFGLDCMPGAWTFLGHTHFYHTKKELANWVATQRVNPQLNKAFGMTACAEGSRLSFSTRHHEAATTDIQGFPVAFIPGSR